MKYAFRWRERAVRQLRAIPQPAALTILQALTPLGDDPRRHHHVRHEQSNHDPKVAQPARERRERGLSVPQITIAFGRERRRQPVVSEIEKARHLASVEAQRGLRAAPDATRDFVALLPGRLKTAPARPAKRGTAAVRELAPALEFGQFRPTPGRLRTPRSGGFQPPWGMSVGGNDVFARLRPSASKLAS